MADFLGYIPDEREEVHAGNSAAGTAVGRSGVRMPEDVQAGPAAANTSPTARVGALAPEGIEGGPGEAKSTPVARDGEQYG